MESIKEIYKIGHGPSSSHTMGPKKAAEKFRARNEEADHFHVTLYGSLAATGRGHLTDVVVASAFEPAPTTFDWQPDIILPFHPCALKFEAFDATDALVDEWTAYSIGGGTIVSEGEDGETEQVYPQANMQEILTLVDQNGETFWEYVFNTEPPTLESHLEQIWAMMKDCIKRGLDNEGALPGELHLNRKAPSFFIKAKNSGYQKHTNKLFAYALAVAEENAAGGVVVTAPTCGSAGVLPAVLFMLQEMDKFPDKKILHALATGGLFGNVVKKNGSISGAEVGCQGEIGTACAMASAAAAQLMGGTPNQIEYAAEMGLEHHLGLTCDPVAGLVQIPCIERNAMGAARAIDCALYALLSDGRHRVSFDDIIQTMVATGHDLTSPYRETAKGGLAALRR